MTENTGAERPSEAGSGEPAWVDDIHCCDACHEARTTLPGHRALGCFFNPEAARPVDAGFLETCFRDGEWRLIVTEQGRSAFAAAQPQPATGRAAARQPMKHATRGNVHQQYAQIA